MNSSERRSSRSIKRKRFDDEIVDYASPTSFSRSSRQRTHSQSNTSLNTTLSAPDSPGTPVAAPAPAVPLASSSSSGLQPLTSTPPIDSVGKPLSPTSVPTAIAQTPVAAPRVQPAAAAIVKEEKELIQSVASPVQKIPTPAAVAPATPTVPTIPLQIKQELPPVQQINPPPVGVASPRETSFSGAQHLPTPLSVFSSDRNRRTNGRKRNGKKAGTSQMSTKDLGRWKPVDDLALIIGVQQTNDMKMVHRGTKFSCKFTLNELQNRWYALLYEESVSRIAVAAMRNLHPELVENVQSKALYTAQEEDLLATIKSSEAPTLHTFAELLRKHSSVFYSARTPKSLQSHWQLMKQYTLLPDQVLKVPGKDGTILSFSDNEELLNDAELLEPKDEALDAEMTLVDRRNKREIRNLETELGRWNVLVDSMTGMGFPPEFDRQTLAVLRGRLVRYLMRSREITIGRSTKDSSVDVDLSLEGSAIKVSRKQGTIKLRSNADFFLTNEGKRPIYVDGTALLTGYKTRLSHNCTIEIAGLRFTFLVNFDLINAIQQESAKMNTPLT